MIIKNNNNNNNNSNNNNDSNNNNNNNSTYSTLHTIAKMKVLNTNQKLLTSAVVITDPRKTINIAMSITSFIMWLATTLSSCLGNTAEILLVFTKFQ